MIQLFLNNSFFTLYWVSFMPCSDTAYQELFYLKHLLQSIQILYKFAFSLTALSNDIKALKQYLNLSGATEPPTSTLLVPRTPTPKLSCTFFIKHNRQTKILDHTNIIIKYGKKMCAVTINSVSYQVLKHIRQVL
jgi:hypothetical protein